MSLPLLTVANLRVEIERHGRRIIPVDDVSFDVGRGEIVGIVGESGGGKSLMLRALLGLLPAGGRIAEGQIALATEEGSVTQRPADLRGRGLAMVFQEPLTALNPLIRVGELVTEPIVVGCRLPKREARMQAIELMRSVGIPDAPGRAHAYPHELSGGLRQRVMLAYALASDPRVLLCDEPTTALDVSIQDQILGLLQMIRIDRGVSIVFVSHDLAVVAELCDRVAVMYAGRIVEIGPVDAVLAAPRHPYTAALLRAAPRFDGGPRRLGTIGGTPPDPAAFPTGCRFRTRCPISQADCASAAHRLRPAGISHGTACIHSAEMALKGPLRA